jgi:hypothetical protein
MVAGLESVVGEMVIRLLGGYECYDVAVSAKAQYVYCLAIRAIVVSPSRQRRQFSEKRAERSVGRQARHTVTSGLSICVQSRRVSVCSAHWEQLLYSSHC